MIRKSVRLSLDVSRELNDSLDKMAEETHSSKSEVLRRSIILMDLAVQEKMAGNHLSVVNKNKKVIKEIVGF